MKTAICFTGTGRALQYTGENIKKILIDRHPDCDVFVHLAETQHSEIAKEYFSFDQTKGILIEKDEVIDVKGLRWHPEWPAGLHSGTDPKQTYLNMLLSRKKCGKMLSEYSIKHNIHYDKVIFSRLDVEFFDYLPQDLDLDYICVPDFHHFDMVQGRGCNDRFAIGNLKNMKVYFNLYDSIRDLINRGCSLHGESTLHFYLSLADVKIKKCFIRFTRIRPDGFKQDARLRLPSLEPRDY